MPASSKKSGKSSSKGSGKRTLIAPKGDKRYIRRDEKGRITESDDQGRSLSQDIRKHAQTEAKPGYGDQGDQPQKKSTGAKTAASKKAAGSKKSTGSKKGGAKKG